MVPRVRTERPSRQDVPGTSGSRAAATESMGTIAVATDEQSQTSTAYLQPVRESSCCGSRCRPLRCEDRRLPVQILEPDAVRLSPRGRRDVSDAYATKEQQIVRGRVAQVNAVGQVRLCRHCLQMGRGNGQLHRFVLRRDQPLEVDTEFVPVVLVRVRIAEVGVPKLAVPLDNSRDVLLSALSGGASVERRTPRDGRVRQGSANRQMESSVATFGRCRVARCAILGLS